MVSILLQNFGQTCRPALENRSLPRMNKVKKTISTNL